MDPRIDFHHHNFYLLRMPLLNLDDLEAFNTAADNDALDAQLRAFFSNPLYREALYIASPQMYHEFCRWEAGADGNSRSERKMMHTLYKYLVRMCTRCTPYGLFAGYNMGRIRESTNIGFDEALTIKRHIRLDTYIVAAIIARLLEEEPVKEAVRYFPNNTIYATPHGYRYIEHVTAGKLRKYFLTSFASSSYVEKALEQARNGATGRQLAACLEDDEIDYDTAVSFIEELIDSRILVSELEPPVTGADPLQHVIAFLQQHNINTDSSRLITGTGRLLTGNNGIDTLLAIDRNVKALLPDTDSKDLIQVDMQFALEHNCIGESVITGIQEEIAGILRINVPYNNPDLETFREQFLSRYEEQEVPLAIALDPDLGIGYGLYSGENSIPQPLLGELPLISAPPRESNDRTYHSWLKSRLIRALVNRENEIALENEDLSQFDAAATMLPASFYIMGSLHAASAAALQEGDFLFDLEVLSGPSAANLLARFCHGYSALEQAVRETLREEEKFYGDALLAEIAHLPQDRIGNIIIRPGLRNYEIPLNTGSGVPASHQLPVDDLMVSVKNNTIMLRSRRFNRVVIPRLSAAHNFSSHNIAIYKFLGDLQYQGLRFFSKWNWGSYRNEIFLPRVRYGRTILHKASWNFSRSDFEIQGHAINDMPGFLQSFARVKENYRLPEHMEIVEGDNVLYVNTGSATSLHLLQAHLLKNGRVTVQESFRSREHNFITCGEGRRQHELIIPFTRRPAAAAPEKPGQPAQQPAYIQRKFQTGTEWLTVKIYCGHKMAERLLTTTLLPLANDLQQRQQITRWFFVRYNDPDYHIRIRFYNDHEKDFWVNVLQQVQQHLSGALEKQAVSRIQTDTYNRELERYGHGFIELAESVFHADSLAVMKLLASTGSALPEEEKGVIAFQGIDHYLHDFGYELPAKAAIMQQLYKSFFEEFGGTPDMLKQLNKIYRNHTPLLQRALPGTGDYARVLQERSACIHSLLERNTMFNIPENREMRDRMLLSFIHMSLNRLFTTVPRRHELVVYHHMARYYQSQLARKKER